MQNSPTKVKSCPSSPLCRILRGSVSGKRASGHAVVCGRNVHPARLGDPARCSCLGPCQNVQRCLLVQSGAAMPYALPSQHPGPRAHRIRQRFAIGINLLTGLIRGLNGQPPFAAEQRTGDVAARKHWPAQTAADTKFIPMLGKHGGLPSGQRPRARCDYEKPDPPRRSAPALRHLTVDPAPPLRVWHRPVSLSRILRRPTCAWPCDGHSAPRLCSRARPASSQGVLHPHRFDRRRTRLHQTGFPRLYLLSHRAARCGRRQSPLRRCRVFLSRFLPDSDSRGHFNRT